MDFPNILTKKINFFGKVKGVNLARVSNDRNRYLDFVFIRFALWDTVVT